MQQADSEPLIAEVGGVRGSVSALLALKVSGRHYGENLARLDLLLSSLLHFSEPKLLDEFVVVVPADEESLVRRHLDHWPELPLRVAAEDGYFPAFRRYTRPWQVRPWQRQQIIKLNAGNLTGSRYVLILDPDVLAVKPIRRDCLLPRSRALLEPEPRSVHLRWWQDSARLLAVDPGLDRPGMNVTPAILSTEILAETQRRLEDVNGRPWMDVLLTSYCDWTEYTLYLLAGEHANLLDREHVWAGSVDAPHHLQLDSASSVWDARSATREHVDRMFKSHAPGVFGVVQSNAGLSMREVATVVRSHLPVRAVASDRPQPPARTVRIQERFRTASRLVADRGYRLRRWMRSSGPGSALGCRVLRSDDS